MSALQSTERIVAFTQAASYRRGQANAYAQAMRLVRQIRQRLDQQGAISAAAYEELARLEETLYDESQASSTKAATIDETIRKANAVLGETEHQAATR
jgi:hypothetical protein